MVLDTMKQIAETYLGERHHRGGGHRPRVLRRRAAPGHQGRRARSPASTSGASSTSRRPPRSRTARPQGKATSASRSYDLGGGTFDISILELSDGVFSVQGDRRRHVPRRRRLRRRRRSTIWRTKFETETRHRPARGPHGAAAPEGSGREGAARAVVVARDGDQPPVHRLATPAGRSTWCMTFKRNELELLVEDLVERTLGAVRAGARRREAHGRRTSTRWSSSAA